MDGRIINTHLLASNTLYYTNCYDTQKATCKSLSNRAKICCVKENKHVALIIRLSLELNTIFESGKIRFSCTKTPHPETGELGLIS